MKRTTDNPITWEGNLNDDRTARWSGLMLRAEWMDKDYWWWCVYDMENDEMQIDASNNYDKSFVDGETARKEAERVAREYLNKMK